MPGHVLRVLVTAGLSLAGLTACTEAQAPPETQAPPDDVEAPLGKSESALGVTYSDFIANASSAFWSNNDGGVPWGIGGLSDTRGSAKKMTNQLEDGPNHTFLYTQPKWANNSYMRGAYTVTIPVATQHPTLTATFGFIVGGGTGDGVTFSAKAGVNGSWVTLFSETKVKTNSLHTQTADLSPYAGQTLEILISAETGASYSGDWPAWTDLRIVTDTAVPPADCMIGGVHYATGDVNPAVSCQICEPVTSTTAWTTRGDSCLIGGTCYGSDDLDALGCKKCDPMTSQTSWTNKASCDNLIVAVNRSNRIGNFGGIGPADAICAEAGADIGLPGKWQAMLSKAGTREYKDTVLPAFATMPVVNLQGEQLYPSWNDIFTNQVWPAGISIYQIGSSTTSIVGAAYDGSVWTGAGADGLSDPNTNNCDGWTSTGYWNPFWTPRKGAVGSLLASERKLVATGGALGSCDWADPRRLLCVLTPPAPIVTTQNYDGTAAGDVMAKTATRNDAFAWLGVPYAAPPTGSLRLAPPAKMNAWSGVRNAFSMGSMCAQKGFFPGPNHVGSEDCLYLNIWAPKTSTPSSNLPVFVYHHPGGLMYGGANAVDEVAGMGMFDGDRLAAAQNMVVVTMQTRLAAFGYLALPELSANSTSRTSTVGGGTSGNYGLLDAIQALKWIKKNISKFGGDPTHVTFAGASGGATMVGLLLSSPLSKDPADNKPYFSSAFMMSGFYEEPSMAYRYTQGTAMLPTAHCESATDKVACLRSASTLDFTAMAGDFLMFVPDMLNAPTPPELAFGLKLGPSVDGYVIPTQPRAAYAAGTHQKVPVIVGSTRKEFSSFMVTAVAGVVHALTTGNINDMVYLPTCGSFTSRANLNLGATLAAAALPLYPCNPTFFLGPTTAYSDAMTHVQYECPARRTARALVTGPSPASVRRYQFNHYADHIGVFQNLLGLVPQIGPAHALDQAYVFNNHSTIVLGLPTYWPSQRELELAGRYGKYIRAFAATGDPNYTGGNAWAAYDKNLDNALSLKAVKETGPTDPGPSMIQGIDTSYCDFWDNNFTLDGWK